MNAIDRDDTEKKIAEIREALGKATPGPWKIADTTDGYVLLDADDRELAFCDSIGRVDDARFIANAPGWLRFLLDELDREREESRKLREERDAVADGYRQQVELAGELIDKLALVQEREQIPVMLSVEEQNELLKKVAESYARIINDLEEDCERYFDQRNRLIECLLFYERLARGREVNDGGRRARTLLAEIGVTVE